jgi:molybdopterin/thiamine biosynthesis adenylyltransferase
MNDNKISRFIVQQQEQYDRQIRLWGLDAQLRMQQSSVLVYGLSGLHVEVWRRK